MRSSGRAKRFLLSLPLLAGCAPCAGRTAALPADYAKTPVLMVHGSGLSRRTWRPMIDHLEGHGYPPSYLSAVDLKPNNGSNIRAAETFIAPAVERLLRASASDAQKSGRRPPGKVAIVAHSMGAVSSRWYSAKMRPDRVRTMITIAGSNHGTSALLGIPGDGNREMVPPFASSVDESAVQVALNGTAENPIDETPHGIGLDRKGVHSIRPNADREILYLTIRIASDRWIQPESSAVLDGAGGLAVDVPAGVPVIETSPGNFLYQGRSGHDNLPRHPDVVRLVESLLRSHDRSGSEGR